MRSLNTGDERFTDPLAPDRGRRWRPFPRVSAVRLPVLLYHHVGPLRPGTCLSLTVSPERFERQVRWLSRHGYVGIRTTDWLAWCRGGGAVPDKPVLLTFDDGYADLADHALPVLRRYGFSAVVFVVTGQIGGSNVWDEARGFGTQRLLTAAQICQWSARGIEFGAHGRTHADLTKLTDAKLIEEVTSTSSDLAAIIGTRVVSFAYPYGAHDETVRRYVKRDFDLAFTVTEGLNTCDSDPYRLRRTMVQHRDTIIDFACRVRLGWDPVLVLRTRVARIRRHLRP